MIQVTVSQHLKHHSCCVIRAPHTISPGVGCAALVGDILPGAWQEAGQGELGDVGRLPAVLDIAQLGDNGPEAHVVVVPCLPPVGINLNLVYRSNAMITGSDQCLPGP